MAQVVGYWDREVVLENPRRRFVMTRGPFRSHFFRIEIVRSGTTDPVVASIDRCWAPCFKPGWETREDLEPIVDRLNDMMEAGDIPLNYMAVKS